MTTPKQAKCLIHTWINLLPFVLLCYITASVQWNSICCHKFVVGYSISISVSIFSRKIRPGWQLQSLEMFLTLHFLLIFIACFREISTYFKKDIVEQQTSITCTFYCKTWCRSWSFSHILSDWDSVCSVLPS